MNDHEKNKHSRKVAVTIVRKDTDASSPAEQAGAAIVEPSVRPVSRVSVRAQRSAPPQPVDVIADSGESAEPDTAMQPVDVIANSRESAEPDAVVQPVDVIANPRESAEPDAAMQPVDVVADSGESAEPDAAIQPVDVIANPCESTEPDAAMQPVDVVADSGESAEPDAAIQPVDVVADSGESTKSNTTTQPVDVFTDSHYDAQSGTAAQFVTRQTSRKPKGKGRSGKKTAAQVLRHPEDSQADSVAVASAQSINCEDMPSQHAECPTGIQETVSHAPELPASPDQPAKWYIPQPFRDISIPRKLIMFLSVLLFLFSIIPLFIGVFTPGVLPPVCIAAFFFACALYWPVVQRVESLWGNILIGTVAVCVLAGICYLAFVSGKMLSASLNTLPEGQSHVTVVVLGCKINGDKPSRMLSARLNTAAEFLLANPQAHCIVTGGKGEDEDYPEAVIMKNWLVERGVSSMRILVEDESTSTDENIGNACLLADVYNCHDTFLIVTDRFHEYRAISAANRLGVTAYALNTETVWYLAMPYWFREIAAITRDWVAA